MKLLSIVFGICLVLVSTDAAEMERAAIRYISDVKVDGDTSEWDGHPFEVLGLGEPIEKEMWALMHTGWSATGLLLAIDLSGKNISNRMLVDVFIDVRDINTARMDHYEKGVFHLTMKPLREPELSGSFGIVNSSGVVDTSTNVGRFFARKCIGGWALEAIIPWKQLGIEVPQTGRWIGYSLRIRSWTNSGNTHVFGAESVDSSNTLETTPIAFDPRQILPATGDHSNISCRVEEVLVQGEPWLEIETIAPVKSAKLDSITASVPDLGIQRQESAVRSFSSAFRIARIRERLTPAHAGATLAVNVDTGEGRPERSISILTPVAFEWARIDRELPEADIAAVSLEERGIIEVLKECAKEIAAQLCLSPDGLRPPQRSFRAIFDRNLYKHKIDAYVVLAKEFLAGRKVDASFPLRGWQSNIDGSWLPFKLRYPANFYPDRSYPATLIIDGLDVRRNRQYFATNDLLEWQSDQLSPSRYGGFQITLFNRGNAITAFGDEEITYLCERFLQTLNIDRSRIGLVGLSAAGADVLQMGIEHPDRFAWIECRGSNFFHLLNGENASDLGHLLLNLRHTGLYVEFGANDADALVDSNYALLSLLKSHGLPFEYYAIPNTGHGSIPHLPPQTITSSSLPESPREIEFSTLNPTHGNSYWLKVEAVEDWGRAANIKATLSTAGLLKVDTTNVRAFSLESKALEDREFPVQVEVDQHPTATIVTRPLVGRTLFAHENGPWTLTAKLPEKVKTEALCGPARLIELRSPMLVYGTMDRKRTPWLRDRAFKVIASRVGAGRNQFGAGLFQLKSDVDVTEEDIATRNLWLIGGAQENSVVARFADRLPISVENGAVSIKGLDWKDDVLLSYIFPNPEVTGLVYIEEGSSDFAYSGDVLARPETDICIQQIRPGDNRICWSGNFDGSWSLREVDH